MGLSIITDADFDPTLPLYAPEPTLTPTVRWSAAGLAGLGPVPEWPTDLGTAVSPAATGFTAPVLEEDADGIPGVHFDTNTQLTYPVTPPAVETIYAVFSVDAIGGHGHTLFTTGGPIVVIDATGKLAVTGSAGNNVSAPTLVAGHRYAAAVVIDTTGGSTTIDVAGTTQTVGGYTATALNKYKFGAATGSYLDGFVYELSLYSAAHTAGQRAAELARLRAWYAAS